MAECCLQEKSNYITEPQTENMQVTCIFHPKQYVELFCTKCQDAVCSRCMVEKHQQHPTQMITDACGNVRQQIVDWHSNKEETLQKLKDVKQQLESVLKEKKQKSAKVKGDIKKIGEMWKIKIENDVELLSTCFETNFDKCTQQTNDLITEIEYCERSMISLEMKTEPEENMTRLYQTVKASMNTQILHVLLDVENSASVPTVNLNQPSVDTLIGRVIDQQNIPKTATINQRATKSKFDTSVQTSDDEDLMVSSDAVVNGSLVEHKSVVKKIVCRQPITKIVPISEKDAWLISDRKLYKMTANGIKISSFTDDVDDIADMGNENLLILNRHKSFIAKKNGKGNVTHFTCTDPYLPVSMDFVQNEGVLLVFQIDKQNARVVGIYKSDGTKQSDKVPPGYTYIECCNLSAHTGNKICCVVDISRDVGVRSMLYYFNIQPCDHGIFIGRFGFSPYLQFICKGVCHDAQGSIIASDLQFNTIHKLNEKAQFQKTLLTGDDGLKSPTALAFRDGLLWVADETFIRVFRYEEIK